MALCGTQGRPDMYGIGIRIAVYVQWLGAALIHYMDETDMPDVRLLGLLLSGALAVGLVVQLAGEKLHAVDIFITLLLTLGIFLFLVPIFLWRALTCCNPYWNPLRYCREVPSPAIKLAHYVLLLCLASIGIWFHTTYLTALDHKCDHYGFFFSKAHLQNKAFIAFSAMFYLVVILVCAGIFFLKAGCDVRIWTKERRRRRAKQAHVAILREFRFFADLVVFAILVAGIELTIEWNDLQGINDVNTAAQAIPLFISVGFVVRTIFLHFAKDDDDDSLGDPSTFAYESYYRGGFRRMWPGQPPAAPPPVHSRV